MATFKLHYLFDPLCGWCYASAGALRGLAERFPDALQLHPTGLFAGPGARVITPEFAEYARSNDLRIASLTGQPFAAAYFEQILGGRALRFDSMPMSRALTWVRGHDSALEPKLYAVLQTARYVEGLDTSSADVVAACTADLLSGAGYAIDAQTLHTTLTQQAQFAEQTASRIEDAQALMREVGARGVPLLLVEINQAMRPISGADLYRDPGRLVETIEQLLQQAA
ncbi:DsbA family protein [Pseudomonas sp. NY15463]|uniref:DsbA family protein n=1 Tax=Pseudomonas sp. NY15463 TaxID=3400361 RepID=UPI003A878A03